MSNDYVRFDLEDRLIDFAARIIRTSESGGTKRRFRLQGHYLVTDRVFDQSGHGVNVQLGHDVLAVGIHRTC